MTLPGLFLLASLQYRLPPDLLKSICWIESKHVATAIHKDDGNGDSIGICQIKLNTAKMVGFKGTQKDLLNPKINIEYAAKYLQHLQSRYNDTIKMTIAYNIGKTKRLTRTKYSDKVLDVWRTSINGRQCK